MSLCHTIVHVHSIWHLLYTWRETWLIHVHVYRDITHTCTCIQRYDSYMHIPHDIYLSHHILKQRQQAGDPRRVMHQSCLYSHTWRNIRSKHLDSCVYISHFYFFHLYFFFVFSLVFRVAFVFLTLCVCVCLSLSLSLSLPLSLSALEVSLTYKAIEDSGTTVRMT